MLVRDFCVLKCNSSKNALAVQLVFILMYLLSMTLLLCAVMCCSARKRPVPYYRPSPSPSSSLSWSSLSPVFRFSHSPVLRRRQRLRTGSPTFILWSTMLTLYCFFGFLGHCHQLSSWCKKILACVFIKSHFRKFVVFCSFCIYYIVVHNNMTVYTGNKVLNPFE